MAFADQSLNNNAAVAKSFVKQTSVQNGSDFVESTATATEQRKIVLRHTNAGVSVVKGAKPIRRHLAQFFHEKFNATLGKTEKLSLNVTLTVDPGTTFTTTDQYDLVAFAKNFLTTGNVDKLVRDES